jgi:hypothetical protein
MIIYIVSLRSEYNSINKENIRLKHRKVKASDDLIHSFEQAMIKAVDAGDLDKYKEYYLMYNDLIPYHSEKGGV